MVSRTILYSIIGGFFCFAGLIVFGQVPSLRFHKLSVEDGLSQNSVNCILQDNSGFMWFGTRAGLNKFDGYQFTCYQFNPKDTNSISDTWINCLLKLKNGNLLIGTRNGGLNEFNPFVNRFQRHHFSDKTPGRLMNISILSLEQSADGKIWVGTTKGLYVSEDCKNFFPVTQTSDTAFQHNPVTAIFADNQGSLWMGTSFNEITEYRIKEKKVVRYSDVQITTRKFQIKKLDKLSSGLLILATQQGLRFFDTYTHRFTNGLHDFAGADSLLQMEVKNFSRDQEGRIWCSVQNADLEGGLACIDFGLNNIRYVLADANYAGGLSKETIQSLFTDNSGIIWVGFDGKGINYFHPRAQKFRHFSKENKEGIRLSSDYIFSIFEDEDESVWLGTSDKGINHIDFKTGKADYYVNGLFSNNHCTDIEPEENSKLWISFNTRDDEGGAVLFDKKSGDFQTIDQYIGKRNPLGTYKITCLLNEKDFLWLGTSDAGLCRVDKKAKNIRKFFHKEGDNNSLPGNEITYLYRDSNGSLWIGTRSGLSKMTNNGESFTSFVFNQRDKNSISNNNILSILEDRNKNLWISTAHGLNRFDYQKEVFTLVSTDNGLSNNHIYGALEDKAGNLWLSTNNGLNRYHPVSQEVRIFSIEDGLQSKEFNTNSFHLGKTGKFYFGGIGGFNVFTAENIRENNYMPQVVITHLSVLGKTIPLDSAIFTKKIIQLEYSQNFFTLDFASLDYLLPTKNKFECLLEGLENEWIALGNRHSVSYSNLSPGKYVFRLKGTNDDGVWSKNQAVLTIVVLPPFYMTSWFYFLCALVTLAVVWLIYRQRIKTYLKTQKELREQVRIRTEKIEQQKAELNESHQQLARISELGLMITSSLDLEAISKMVYEGINSMIDAKSFGIGILTEGKNEIDFKFVFDEGKRIFPESVSLNNQQSIAAWCIRNRQEIFTGKSEDIRIHYSGTPIYEGEMENSLESFLMIPLLSGNRCLGVITAQSAKKNAYNELHLQTLRSLAGYIAVAVDNSNAYQFLNESKNQLEKLSIVAKETANAVVIADPEGNIEWVNEGFTRMTGYSLEELTQNVGSTIFIASGNPEIKSIISHCVKEKKSVFYEALNTTKSGKKIWVRTSLTPVLDENGNIKKLVAIDSDFSEIKKAEEKIKASEKQYKTLYDQNGDFLFIYDKGTHYIMDCNQTFVDFYGYSKEELRSMTPFDLIPETEHLKLAMEIDVAAPHKASYYTHKTKAGNLSPVEVRSVEIEFNGRNAWLVITRDITERKKAEEQILHQRDLIEAKNKDITDSINYARRIQQATLPTQAQMQEAFPEHFVFFRPKDIVSGDFYWLGKSENGKVYFATADCTGHGVPGAILSVIGTTKLEEIVSHRPVTNPADALHQLRVDIVSMLNHYGAEKETDDGIDMVLCSFDFQKTAENKGAIMEFVCAKNPLWIIRNDQLTEYLPDHFCVGKDNDTEKPFTLHRVELQKGDKVYMFSDGFADQFGGKTGKKFKSKKLQDLLLQTRHYPMQKQKEELEKTLDEWRGNFMQVDDICVVGITI